MRLTLGFHGKVGYSGFVSCGFCRAMLCKRDISRYAVSVHLSVTFVDCVKMNKHIFNFFSPSVSHTIIVFPNQTSWQYSDGNPSPNGGVECRWGRQKSRFWAYIWLLCVLWTVPAAVAIQSASTDHSEFITLVADKRRSLLMARDDDKLYDRNLSVTPKTTLCSGKSEA